MKKYGMLLALLGVVLCTTSTQGALISLYEFDQASGTTTTNSVAGQGGGTLLRGGGWTTGMIGSGAYSVSTSTNSYINIINNTIFNGTSFGDNSTGFWSGTYSVWAKINFLSGTDHHYFQVQYAAEGVTWGGDRFGRIQNNTGTVYLHENGHRPSNNYNDYIVRVSTSSAPTGRIGTGTTNTEGYGGLQDNTWHLITVSYDMTTGDQFSGNYKFYMDGRLLTNTSPASTSANGVTSDYHVGASTSKMLFAGRESNGGVWSQTGKFDDFANWNVRLSDAKIRALDTLGRDALKYGAKNADQLFEYFDNASRPASLTIGDTTWQYVASGLGASGGIFVDYQGSRALVLDTTTGSGLKIQGGPVDLTWVGTTSDAGTTSNWTPVGLPNGTKIIFDDSGSGTVDISADITPTEVIFNNSLKDYVVTGSKGFAGSATLTKNGSGSATLGSVNTYTGLTTLNQGTLILKDRAKGMKPVMENAGIQMATKISVGGGNNKLVLDYSNETSPATEVKNLLTTSYDAANPTTHFAGTGKFASSIAGVANSPYAIGWKDDTAAKAITVGVTRYGDATMDGIANFDDLGKVLARYNLAGTWSDGDFTYDGIVNFDDLGKLLANYNQSVGAAASATPEPTSLILLATLAAMAGGWFIRRRVA